MEKAIYIEGIEVEFKHLGAPVMYVPEHADKNEDHPDCEIGFISKVDNGIIQIRTLEIDHTCEPHNLRWA